MNKTAASSKNKEHPKVGLPEPSLDDTALGAVTNINQVEKPFRLLDLPPELWSRVCEFAVVSDEPIEIRLRHDHRFSGPGLQWPNITRVCKVLRREALRLYYQRNTFELHRSRMYVVISCKHLGRLLDIIGRDTRPKMQRLHVIASGRPAYLEDTLGKFYAEVTLLEGETAWRRDGLKTYKLTLKR